MTILNLVKLRKDLTSAVGKYDNTAKQTIKKVSLGKISDNVNDEIIKKLGLKNKEDWYEIIDRELLKLRAFLIIDKDELYVAKNEEYTSNYGTYCGSDWFD